MTVMENIIYYLEQLNFNSFLFSLPKNIILVHVCAHWRNNTYL